jgi:hypothetical protein
MHWIRPAVEATVTLVARTEAPVIWATAGPVSSFLVAERASRRTGVPFVLDFRDPWTITRTDFEARRPAWAIARDRRTLYRLLAAAQAVVFRFVTEAESYWRAYEGALDAGRIHIVPNGYEGHIAESVVPRGEYCTLLYTGTVSSYRYDSLLHALSELKRVHPVQAQRLRVRFIGEGTGELTGMRAALGLEDILELQGPVSRAEITRLQREAHALLVLGRWPTIRGYELLAGAKAYEYFKAGRPIVGVLPLDETRRALRSVGTTTVADVDSLPSIVAVLRRVMDAWEGDTLESLAPDRAACGAFSAERQTAVVARALEGRLAEQSFVPGSVEVPPSLRNDVESGRWLPSEFMGR